MKKLFVTLLIFTCAHCAFAQFPSRDPVPKWNRMQRVDSFLWVDTKDTTGLDPKRIGTVVMRRQSGDTSLYVSNGNRFVKIGSNVLALDSTLYDPMTGRFNFRYTTGGNLFVATGLVDSLRRRIDSSRISNDTIFFRRGTTEIPIRITGLPQANINGLPDSIQRNTLQRVLERGNTATIGAYFGDTVSGVGIGSRIGGKRFESNSAEVVGWFGQNNTLQNLKAATPVQLSDVATMASQNAAVSNLLSKGIRITTDTSIQVFTDQFARTSLGGSYVSSLPGATLDMTGSKLRLTGTANNYLNFIKRDYYTCVENFTMTLRYVNNTIGSTTYGVAVGMFSENAYGYTHHVTASLFQNTGNANIGKAVIVGGDTRASAVNATSTIPAISVGDTIEIKLVRRIWDYSVTVRNVTTGQVSTVAKSTSPSVNTFPANNTSRPVIHFFGGDITVTSWNYVIDERPNPAGMFIGNSIIMGGNASSPAKRAATTSVSGSTAVQVNSGGADYSANVLSRLPEILLIKPKVVYMGIGGNDILFGVASSTWGPNIRSITTQLLAAGIGVTHIAPTPRNTTNVKPLYDTLVANYMPNVIKDTYWGLLSATNGLLSIYDSGDGVHPNDAGQRKMSDIIQYGIIPPMYDTARVPVNSYTTGGYKALVANSTTGAMEVVVVSPTFDTATAKVRFVQINPVSAQAGAFNLTGNSQVTGNFNITNTTAGQQLISGVGPSSMLYALRSSASIARGYEWIGNSSLDYFTSFFNSSTGGHRVAINKNTDDGSTFQVNGTGSYSNRVTITGANGYAQFRLVTSYTPTSSADTNGSTGDIAKDDNYIYVKTSTGWKRTALTTF